MRFWGMESNPFLCVLFIWFLLGNLFLENDGATLEANGSSKPLRFFNFVFALRMASVSYPCTARIVQPQWGEPEGKRSSWAGGAASFCRVARACGAAAVRGS